MKKISLIILSVLTILSCTTTTIDETPKTLTLTAKGSYSTDLFDEGGAEIVSYNAVNKQIIFVNANMGGITILDAADINNLKLVKEVRFNNGEANSVAVSSKYIAVAVNAKDYPDTGMVMVLDLNGTVVTEVAVGFLPDMVCFTKDGKYILSANEGEPNKDYSIDPEGSVSIIEVENNFTVSTLTFNESMLVGDVRITGPAGTSVARDIEPEYIAIDGMTAYVSCQENNAIAKVDIANKKIIGVYGLGTIDHSIEGKGIDAGKDGKAMIELWPTRGMFMPDSLASFNINGETFIVTANEGDDREYGDYEDAVKAKKLKFDPQAFSAEELMKLENSGIRLSAVNGDANNDGLVETAYSFGTRSFTIWNSDVEAVWNSDDTLEQLITENHPEYIGISDDNLTAEDRSEKKGPEPEAAATGVINDKTYAFIGLERDGGILAYDVSSPEAPVFQQYINTRNFNASVDSEGEYTDTSFENTGDLSPEGMCFVSQTDSPSGKPLLIVGYEVSGSVRVFEID